MPKKWSQENIWTVGNEEPVTFIGRRPAVVSSERVRRGLRGTGVFKDLPGERMQYIGAVQAILDDGTKKEVDLQGNVDIDFDSLPAGDEKERLELEFEEEEI